MKTPHSIRSWCITKSSTPSGRPTATNTQGGTTLGVRLDRDRSNVTQADCARQSGTVHLEGTLTLNDVPVWCIADLDLPTLQGYGHLALVES